MRIISATMFRQINMFVLFVIGAIVVVDCFPDGGPADTCVKERFNQPNHGQARTQPQKTLPYDVVATTDSYQPGQQIQGTHFLFNHLDPLTLRVIISIRPR